MSQQKTNHLNPIKSAKENLVIDKTFVFSNLDTLHDCVIKGEYSFHFSGNFSCQHEKTLLDGKVTGNVELICQRTLEPFTFNIESDIKLGFVTDDRFFKNFPDDYEPYIYKDNQIDLTHLIEEEVLLCIPMIPKKERNDCQVEQNTPYCGVLETGDTEKQDKHNPFAALKELKFNKKLK
ncbi:YceD family protein [Fastidiosibacter lacustris]|uniref:YceD family protein n=1 Tax=Fastidiosibacter lacustris TaxID=2056695 RepID=UPI000E357B29|nr:DUF177 domain-containing protein [Fastidiosibacter lacustris]